VGNVVSPNALGRMRTISHTGLRRGATLTSLRSMHNCTTAGLDSSFVKCPAAAVCQCNRRWSKIFQLAVRRPCRTTV